MGWVGRLLHSSFSNKHNGVLILIHKNVSFILLKQTKDADRRIICVEAMVEGLPLVLCNIYAPNKGDPSFFHEVNKTLGVTEGELILAGDFNEVIDPILDRSLFRPPFMTKERSAIHMLNRDVGLTDIWRLINPNVFFSPRHAIYFTINLFLINTSGK